MLPMASAECTLATGGQPSNVLLDRKCNVKVADFGLARSVAQLEPDSSPIMTDYVATRWYGPSHQLMMHQKPPPTSASTTWLSEITLVASRCRLLAMASFTHP
jgi:serine/threonine protein kinase